MKNGDDCGTNGKRQAKILFECGNSTQIAKIIEPSTCSYEIYLQTELVCDNRSMLIYPNLNDSLRNVWNLLYTEYSNGLILKKVH